MKKFFIFFSPQLFIACLVNLQSNQLLLDIDNKKLFGNVEEIYSCNDLFWKKYLAPVVETSRKTGEPLNPDLLREGFMDFHNMFKCYETYCTQQSKCQQYCREKLQQEQDNDLFTAYLAVSVSLRGGGWYPHFWYPTFFSPFFFFPVVRNAKRMQQVKTSRHIS